MAASHLTRLTLVARSAEPWRCGNMHWPGGRHLNFGCRDARCSPTLFLAGRVLAQPTQDAGISLQRTEKRIRLTETADLSDFAVRPGFREQENFDVVPAWQFPVSFPSQRHGAPDRGSRVA